MSIAIKLLLFAAFVFAMLAAGFSAGYHWKGYSDLRKSVDDLKSVTRDQYNQTVNMLDSNKKLVDHVDNLNQATADSQAHTAALLEDQDHAMQNLSAKLRDQSFGSCRFDPAADGLFLDAYRAVYPVAAAAPAAQGHQAAR